MSLVGNRIKQFFRALGAKITEDDKEFIAKYLTAQERALFYQMDIVDQRHSLDVAFHVYQASTAKGLGGQRRILVKAALLHDIGKVKAKTSILSRVMYVLLRPWAKKGNFPGWKGLNQHAERGAHMALTFGSEQEVVELIKAHHDPDASGVSVKLLQEADELY